MSTFEQEWQKRFERFARHYASDHLISGWSDSGLRRRLSLFAGLLEERRLPGYSQVLDLGCGAGSYVRHLANLGYWVVGVDYSLPSLSRAVAADPKRIGQYVGAQAYHLAFRDQSFDLVASIGVFQALTDPEQAIDEMLRVLRPNGLIVVEFLNSYAPVSILRAMKGRFGERLHDVRAYSPFTVTRWFRRRGLKVVRRAGIYLPPRTYPWLGRIFDRKGVITLIEEIPGLSLMTAHAFFVAGKKI